MKLLSFADLRTKGIPHSKAHIHRLMKAGKFPRAVKVGENRNAWIEAEIDAHIEAKIAERDGLHDQTNRGASAGAACC